MPARPNRIGRHLPTSGGLRKTSRPLGNSGARRPRSSSPIARCSTLLAKLSAAPGCGCAWTRPTPSPRATTPRCLKGGRAGTEKPRNAIGSALALLHLNDARNGVGRRRHGHSKISGRGRYLKRSGRHFSHTYEGFRRSLRRPMAARRQTLKRCGWLKNSRAGCLYHQEEYRIST